jgi:hypothetical protein
MRSTFFNSDGFKIWISALLLIMMMVPVAGCSAPAAAPAPAPAASAPLYTNPKLGVSPLTIDVAAKEGQSTTQKKSLTIANEGEGVMIWAARKTASWLWMEVADGALEKGFSKTIDVFVSPSAMVAGTYTDKISVEGTGSRNSPQTVLVTMKISPPDAPVTDVNPIVKKAVPAPPWDYSEYKNDTYNFRLRYPKEYTEKQMTGASFGAVTSSKQQADTIMLNIAGSYGVDYKSVAEELTKSAIRAAGGKPNPKIIADDNATTLADGSTPAYEMLYESKSTATLSYQCYLFGTQHGSRYVFFVGCAPLPYATERVDLWKQIGHTLEFLD